LLNVVSARQAADLPTRYRFLDSICSLGRVKLDEAEETRWMRDQHAAFYVDLIEAAEPELLRQNQVRWFKSLQAEHDNLHAVVEWSMESDQPERALRLTSSLLWFWFSFGSAREGRDLTLKALGARSAVQHKDVRAKALSAAGFLLCVLGETARARELLEEALSIQRITNHEANLAWSLQFLGLVLANEQEFDLADAAFQEGLALARKSGDVHTNSFLHFLGDIYLQKGDHLRAKKIYEDSVYLLKAIGSKSFLAYPLRRLGYLALWESDIPQAWEYFQESLTVNREVGDQRAVAACLVSLAALALHMEEPILAARLYGVVESRLESLSVNLLHMDQEELERVIGKLPTVLDEATFTAAVAEGWKLSEEEAIDLAEDILTL
jgi:tetratricopeptide (TPR) repeat protein